MGPTGRLVTIKRSGVDGPHFPLSLSTCLFGRGIECDIRIQLPVVSKQHCKIEINEQEAVLFNFSSTNPTQLNGSAIDEPVQLKHGDVITIVDRSFRYENESRQNGSESTEFPGQRCEQGSLRRVSRSSFSSDPDGKFQDSNACSKLTEEKFSGRPLVHGKNVKAASTVSDDSGGHVARKTPHVHSSELPGDDCRNPMDPTPGGFKEDSSVTLVSCNGELKSFPSTQCLRSSEKNESPFRKLYESMKEELDVKSEKENVLWNRRKSRSQSHCPTENESAGGLQGGTQLLVSPKSRQKSGQSTQIKVDPASGEQGSSQTQEKRTDEEPVQTPKKTMSPSIPHAETAGTKTPVQHSQRSASRKRQSEDLSVMGGSESVNPGQSEGFRADNKTFTPRKSLTRNQTPTKAESAGNLGNTPDKLFSTKRRSIPTNVDVLTTETEIQNQTVLAPLLVQVERKIQNDALNKPEKLDTTAGQMCSGSPDLSSVDVSNFGDSINKTEGMSLKRRRVSFGGHLRPELFDENLPPNTPLKRGETPMKRRSLVTHTPAVLKKIIKEQSQSSRKEDSPSETHLEVTTQNVLVSSPALNPTKTSPVADDQHCRSSKASSVSSDSKSPHQTDTPKRGGRRSGNLPSKRTSIDRSQHELLQMIYSKRRSGASEANLVVAKSWADVVKLGAKQAQTKVVKHGPQRQPNKKQRKVNTPKKPTGSVHNQFSTGHANSPCTIVIGKAHLEKVNVPARPYRMLNNFVFNKKMDFNEDLSGLTEMFKTPAKEKTQMMSIYPITFSNSEDFLGKKFQVPNSEEKPVLCTSKNFGESVFPSTQKAAKEPSDKSSVSPALKQQNMRVNEDIVETPRNIYKMTGAEMKTPVSEAEPPKAAASTNKSRRSVELRNTQTPGVEGKNEEMKTDTMENILERHRRKTPLREQKLEGEVKESERSFEICKNIIESKENSEKMIAVRRSRRSSELKWEPTADLTAFKRWQETEPKEDLADIQSLLQYPDHVAKPVDVQNKTTKLRCKSPKPEPANAPTKMSIQLKMPPQKVDVEELSALGKPTPMLGETTLSHKEPVDDEKSIQLFKETARQELAPVDNVTGSKRRTRTPKKKTQPLEDLAGFRELFQTPDHSKESMTDEKTVKVLCQSPQAEPVISTSLTRQLKTPLQKVDIENELSAIKKPTQTPEKTTLSHKEPVDGERSIAVSQEAPEQKLDPAENVTGSKRQTRTPKKKIHSLEDLAGFKELFQTPDHAKESMTDEKTAEILCLSPQAEPVTSTSLTRQLKTPLRKVDVEELSTLRKPKQTPGEDMFSHKEPAGGDRDMAASQEAPEQKLAPAENATGSRRRTRTPKKKIRSLEDLAGFKELFRTPDHTKEPMTDDKTTKTSCKSPPAEQVNTPTGTKRWLKTPPQKVDIEGELPAFGKPTPTPGDTTISHREPVGGERSIAVSQEAPEQKLDPAENVTGSRRRTRTPKKRFQPLEDLAGFRKLFQMPDHAKESMTDEKTTEILCQSPQAEPVTSTSLTGQLKTPLRKVDVEELSTLRKPKQTPGETMLSHKEPAGGDKDMAASQEAPEQKLAPAENATGSRRRTRTPKKKIHSLEDLAGFRELFQTPDHSKESMTEEKTTEILYQSPQAEPVISTSLTRQLKTPLQKVDIENELSAIKKPLQTPEKNMLSHKEPVVGERSIAVSQEAPEQKLDPAENVTGSKRRTRTPKKKIHSLEDLAGFREPFQTPDHAKESMTGEKTTKISRKSPQAEPVNTPTGTKRWLKTPPRKVDTEDELPALRQPTPTAGETVHRHRERVDIKLFKETSKQELDSEENVTGSKRWPRRPKEKAQLLEDLDGLEMLFQMPDHTKESMTDDKTTKIACKSPQAEPVNTPTSRKRLLRAPSREVEEQEDLSAGRKPTQTLGETTCSHREPVDGDKDIKVFKETARQELDPAENVTGSKRWTRIPKEKAQPLEDLVGFKELFQTPVRTKEPMTDEKTTKTPCKSPQTEPVIVPSRKRLHRASFRKADEQEDLSARRKARQTLRERMRSRREPVSGDNDTKVFKETAGQELDPAANVTGSRRQPRRTKEKAQPLEDLAALKELSQAPDHTKEPVTDDKTTKMPCKSPQVEPVNTNMPAGRKRRLRAPPHKVDIEDEGSAFRKPTPTPEETTHTHGEPVGDDKDIKLFKKTPKQELDPEENVTRSKKQPRIPKKKAQPVEDLAGLKELIQTPDHTDEAMTDEKTMKMPCKSPQVEPVIEPPSKKRRLRAPPQRVDEQGDPSAVRKSTQTVGKTVRSRREPVCGDTDIKVFKETARQELDPAANVTGRKRQPRRTKEKAQPLEDLTRCKELLQTPAHANELGNDAESVKITPTQTPGRRKPVKISRRVLRAPKIKPTANLVGTRDPVQSQRESSVSPSPKGKHGKDGSVTGTKRLRSVTTPPDVVEEKPLQKKQRTAPREVHSPPEPPITEKKSLRILANRIEPVEELPRHNMKTERQGQKVEDTAAPNKGMSLRSRRPNKTNVEEQRPEFVISAENIKIKRSAKKPMNTSQEAKLQNLEDEAKNSTSGGKVPESRMGLRSGRQNKMPSSNVAEEKARKKSVEIHVGRQKEREVTEHSDSKSLRSRKITVPPKGNTSEGESEQRITRGAKRRAETTTKDNDNVYIKKIRTRSRRDNEDI